MTVSHQKLDVAFVWHMHQPYYKDESRQIYAMPWVRLHGIKDYYPMASMLESYGRVKATFNMVPVLVEQLNDYAHNGARDLLLELTLKRPGELTASQKREILHHFFKVHYKHFIEPSQRYFDLLMKRGVDESPANLKEKISVFSDQDILDLQVLFNLSWFHSSVIERDAHLFYLKEKGAGYREDDKAYIVRKQQSILAEIIPLYKRLQDSGKIEIICSPYYHPILPLLCDTNIARVPSPRIPLPRKRFFRPEDAAYHIKRAIEYHRQQFGKTPCGMWPSEGAVSDKVLELFMNAGVRWVITDEDILFKTLEFSDGKRKIKNPPERHLLYRTYAFNKGGRSLTLIFRDKNLSNLISFQYNSWDQRTAALDLLNHLQRIRASVKKTGSQGLVTIVMDGENAWEYYRDNGREFFDVLYSQLDKSDTIRATTISDHLKRHKTSKQTLRNIYPGSWINHNFEVWIGNKEKNLAWEYIGKAREELEKYPPPGSVNGASKENFERGWRELFIAQGSDWNWWHSFESGTRGKYSFEDLFKMHLKNIYKATKAPFPDYLKKRS